MRPERVASGLDPTTTLVFASADATYPAWSAGAAPGLLLRPGLQLPTPGEPEAALLELYLELGVSDIVVYGSVECAALKRALRDGHSRWETIRRTLNMMEIFYADQELDDRGRLEVLVQENALSQLELLSRHRAVRARLTEGLALHAWVHEPGVGVWVYDPEAEQYRRTPRPWRVGPDTRRRALWAIS